MADGVDFRPMENYIRHVLQSISQDGSLIARIFPPEASVLLYFIERISVDVVSLSMNISDCIFFHVFLFYFDTQHCSSAAVVLLDPVAPNRKAH